MSVLTSAHSTAGTFFFCSTLLNFAFKGRTVVWEQPRLLCHYCSITACRWTNWEHSDCEAIVCHIGNKRRGAEGEEGFRPFLIGHFCYSDSRFSAFLSLVNYCFCKKQLCGKMCENTKRKRYKERKKIGRGGGEAVTDSSFSTVSSWPPLWPPPWLLSCKGMQVAMVIGYQLFLWVSADPWCSSWIVTELHKDFHSLVRTAWLGP